MLFRSPIVAALKKVGYRGDVVIESFTPDVKVIARAAAIWEVMKNDLPTLQVEVKNYINSML